MQTRIDYEWAGRSRYVDASADDDVRSLRSKLSKELGLPASQGLRLKCGTRDLRDRDPISAIDATVHAMPSGGLAGGRPGSKRPVEQTVSANKKRLPWRAGRWHGDTGHGYERLAELEQLLSHDIKEPVQGREELWAELKDLLHNYPELRSCLVPPEEEDAGLSAPPPYGPIPLTLSSLWLKLSNARVAQLEQKYTAKIMEIAKLRGALAKANRKLEEAELEPELEEDADDEGHPLKPFEQDIIDLLNGLGSRAIYWIYSLIGAVGKSRFTSVLVTLFDALIIDPHAAKGALELIGKQKEKSAKFVSNPVLILDLPRSEPLTAKKLYQVLETIQGSFSDSNGTMQWKNLPHVIVFANDAPETGRLSADRLCVRLITKEHELVTPLHVENQLKAEKKRQSKLQDQEEEAARTGEAPPREHLRRASGASGAGFHADGFHVPTLRTRTLIQTLTLTLPPNP